MRKAIYLVIPVLLLVLDTFSQVTTGNFNKVILKDSIRLRNVSIAAINATGALTTKNDRVPTDSTVRLAINQNGTGSNLANGLISGGIVTWVSGLTFHVTAATYRINYITYTSAAGTITLNAADPTNPRLDVIGVNTSSTIIKVTGTPAPSPAIPTVNPVTQLYLTAILVNNGATVPACITVTKIYDENVEWTGSDDGSGVNFNNTTNPQNGSKAIRWAPSTSGKAILQTGTALNFSDFTVFKMHIRPNATLPAGSSIEVALYKAGVGNQSQGVVLNASHGFQVGASGSYQTISIPITEFLPFAQSATFDQMIIRVNMPGAVVYFDNIQLQSCITTSTGGNYVTQVYKKAGTDSVFYTVGGQNVFSFLDGNLASANSSASANRSHNFKGFNLTIDSIDGKIKKYLSYWQVKKTGAGAINSEILITPGQVSLWGDVSNYFLLGDASSAYPIAMRTGSGKNPRFQFNNYSTTPVGSYLVTNDNTGVMQWKRPDTLFKKYPIRIIHDATLNRDSIATYPLVDSVYQDPTYTDSIAIRFTDGTGKRISKGGSSGGGGTLASATLTAQTTVGTVLTYTPVADTILIVGFGLDVTSANSVYINMDLKYTTPGGTSATVYGGATNTVGVLVPGTFTIKAKGGTPVTIRTYNCCGASSATFDTYSFIR